MRHITCDVTLAWPPERSACCQRRASGRCSARSGPTSPAHRRGNIPRPIRSRWPTGLFACSASSAIPFSIPSWAPLPRTSPRQPPAETALASRLTPRISSRQRIGCITKPVTCSTSRISVLARSPRLDQPTVLRTPHARSPRLGPRHDLDSGRHRRRGLRHLPTIASRSWRAAACRGCKKRHRFPAQAGTSAWDRIDDLIGEVANAQLHSPEIVIGYIMIFNVAEDTFTPKHGSTWSDLFRNRLQSLSGRRAPSWTTGTVEDFVLVEVDFSAGSSIMATSQPFDAFFDTVVKQVIARNPNAVPSH